MLAYVIRRVLLAIVTLSIVCVIAFSLVNLMPGSVLESRLADAPGAREELMPKLRKELDGVWHPVSPAFQARFAHSAKPIFANDRLDVLATEFIFETELDD